MAQVNLHKKVQVVVIDKARAPKQLLLLQTKKERGSFWQNITGSLEEGETFYKGALRELKEETGIEASSLIDLDLGFKFKDRWEKDVLEQVYLCPLEETPKEIKISELEHQDYKWISIDKVKNEHFKYPSNYEAFCVAINKINKKEKK